MRIHYKHYTVNTFAITYICLHLQIIFNALQMSQYLSRNNYIQIFFMKFEVIIKQNSYLFSNY